jgi:transcriptional regulator with XRE-family HTH domain
MTAAELLRSTRNRHGVSQRALARRAGTSQSWISDVERGRVSPTEDVLRRVLVCLGEDLVLGVKRLDGHTRHNPEAVRRARGISMSERFVEGASWSELATAMQPEE